MTRLPSPSSAWPSPEMPPRSAVVAGSGVVGLATAFELRRRGVAVTLVDPAPVSGASFAAAGMLAPVAETQYGQDALYPLMAASAREYPAFVDAVGAATDVPTGYRTEETLVVGVDPADAQALRDLAAHQEAAGMSVEHLPVRRARSLEPALAPRLSGAVRLASDRQVDPRALCAALSDALARQHVAPLPGAEDGGPVRVVTASVTDVLTDAAPVYRVDGVRTDAGETLRAEAVVLAAGLATGSIGGVPQLRYLRLRPVHGDILRLRVAAEILAPGETHLLTRTIRASVLGRPVYLVPRENGTLVLGATTREDGRESVQAGGVHQLLRDARAVVPAVDECDLIEATARARPGTPDDLPYLGAASAAGLVISTGHFRHGILLSPLAARLAAEILTGHLDPAVDHDHDDAYLAATDPLRHGTAPDDDPAPAGTGLGRPRYVTSIPSTLEDS